MKQFFKDRVYLHHTDTSVQVLQQTLSVFQITKPFLVVLVLWVDTEKLQGLLYLVYIGTTKGKLQADIVFQTFL